jgi:amyloid beta precursor protein binding protein 1
MTASTDIYLKLQRIYRERANKDVQAVESALHELLAANGRQPGSIAHSDVRTFCKNARHLRCTFAMHSATLLLIMRRLTAY